MDMRIPPLETKILLESNPPKSMILVRKLAETVPWLGFRSFFCSEGGRDCLSFSALAWQRQACAASTCIYIYIYIYICICIYIYICARGDLTTISPTIFPNKQKLELLNKHILLNTPLARHLLELLCLVLRIPPPHSSPPPTKTKSRQHGLVEFVIVLMCCMYFQEAVSISASEADP